MRSSSIVAIVVAIIVVGGIIWYVSANGQPSPSTTNITTNTTSTDTTGTDQTQTASSSGSTTSGAPMSATVTYNGTSFSPASVTIAKGGTVTFVAQNGQMWIASNPHPVHTGYDGTSASQHCTTGYTGPKPLDMCAAGSTFSFTFNKTGSFGYHDHLNHSVGGTVVVQ